MDALVLKMLQYLDAGGTVVLIFVVLIMWRTDRRILRLELAIYNGLQKKFETLNQKLDKHISDEK